MLIAQISQLIPYLHETQLVDLFEDEMIETGYLSNSRRPDDDLWENARDWLSDYLEATTLADLAEDLLAEILKDIQETLEK